MTSSDREILISINNRLERIEQVQGQMRAEIRQLQDESIRTVSRLDSLETYGGWLIAAITLMAALMTIFIPVITVIFTRKNSHEEASCFL
ncbi:MAG: hypothetical protein IJG34_00160 [Synergistaceae bacterium]|nr:hypothetical protein [Synergistaceae bacterium]MBQ3448303.1 hypothetical protein [Synergistaceae bacterium]MBQ3694993.1 hypothetical protein [Synergistaceae bacterium]MBQ9628384.1 hypothetical protein [Synergistaceae bacterium]MBR0251229.1 hypothetical protein [Synergistaceae bacterium]